MSKKLVKKQGKRGPKRIPVSTRAFALEEMKIGTDVSALAKRIGVNRSLLYLWQKQERQGGGLDGVVAKSPEDLEIERLKAQVGELEAVVGRKQGQVDFFQSALRRVEALQESSRGNGEKPFTRRSVRSPKAS